ncbi:heavy metal translocating P-type ATPase [Bdellovibrio sp. qaytius]|nr:heavy metal translocating P-type ATPase [Bdellovibrio sp. qaytius]
MSLSSAIKKDDKFKLLLLGVVVAMALELCSILGYRMPTMLTLPMSLLIIFTLGFSVLKKGFQAILKLNIRSINFLMTVAAIGAMALGDYEEATVVIVLFSLAERLEDFGFDSSKKALSALLEKTPKVVRLKDQEAPVPVDGLVVGQIFIIKTGDIIPVDGQVVEGHSYIDESTITGEPLAKEKNINDLVFAGTINQSGYLEVKVLKVLKESTLSKIVELALAANQTKAEVHEFVQRFARIYVPIILISAALITIVPPLFFDQNFIKWFKEALSLLVIACPCALVISTPLSIYCGIAIASKKGAVVKGGKYLELIGKIKAVALDKTRTITFGKPKINQIIPFKNFSESDVLSCAAGLEMLSEHPLAKSVVDEAQLRNLNMHSFAKFESIVGQGVKANCEVCDESISIGKTEFIKNNSALSGAVEKNISDYAKRGLTSVLVADSKGEKGLILLSDEVKPESKAAIRKLIEMNIHVSMLTGDSLEAAKLVSETVDIKDVRANLLPQDKLKEIVNLKQKYGHVAMVGDGVNDAPALARASLGISMGAAGSDAAIETSNVAILNDNLETIPFLIKLGQKTLSTIKFNTAIAVITKFSFLLLALFGRSHLVLAIMADVGLTLFVVMNSLRLLQYEE